MALINCPECSKEISDKVKACPHCGYPLVNEETIKESKVTTKKVNSKKRLYICISVFVIIIIGIAMLIISKDPVRQFKHELIKKNIKEANNIYTNKIEGNENLENEAKETLENQLKNIFNDFVNSKMKYKDAKELLEKLDKTTIESDVISSTRKQIDDLNDSRIAYSTGIEFEKSKDYINALNQFNKVIESDDNYQNAVKKIDELSENFRNELDSKIVELEKNKKYEEIVSLLTEALAVFKDDTVFSSKQDKYQILLEEQKEKAKQELINKYKKEQLVTVTNVKILIQDSEYKALYPDMLSAVILNKSDETIKNYAIGFLGFDKNGYPLKIKGSIDFSDGSYEKIGSAEDVNIVSNASFGKDMGWEIDENHNISKLIACVKEVTFYDGTTWDNPYYPYWIQEYENKEYHE